jgi:tRNA dimethylallyltransferase
LGSGFANLAGISREAPVLIAGPTAAGKSALAMEVAARDGRLIVNADALQVFATWRVLTARPSVADEAALPHALYGHVAAEAEYSVGHWLREVAPLLARPVVIVGGTGLNFRALTEGLADIPPIPAEVRAEGDRLRAAEGIAALLAGLDAATAAAIDRQNGARVQRAWEVQQTTGRGLLDWQRATGAPLLPLTDAEPIVLDADVGWLNDRIARRFRQMVAAGALEEAAAALANWAPTRPYSRAIGAPELIAYLEGRLTLEAAIEAATIASRQYAKRQRTWFRARMAGWTRLAVP